MFYKEKKLLIVVNVDWFFISHRMAIAEKAIEKGWEVYLACHDSGRTKEITDRGIKIINLPISRSGTNLISEFKTIVGLFKIYKNIKPDIIHQVTLKPIIYGSLLCRILKINGVVNAVSGLGYNFTSKRKGIIQKIILKLMKIGFNRDNISVIFQNKDDFKLINDQNIIQEKNNIYFIKGSGVDLDKFKETDLPKNPKIIILFPARMLRDKGLGELRIASEILKDKYYNSISFLLVGMADKENKAGFSENYINDWVDGEYVKWVGYQKNMRQVFANSDIVVLPSYREGMPKSLIEACAIGRPIVTTDAVGCKECVDEGVNGFKVPIQSTIALADAIEKLILSENLRSEMGRAGRIKAEIEFSLKGVVDKHIEIYKSLYNGK